MAYNIVSGNQTYNINTLSSGNVTLPYYAGYKDNTNNITGNIYKSTPIDVSIQYISGSNWLTSITSSLDDTAASIKLNYTDATAERSARIFLKGAGLTTSNYIIINQKKPTTVSFYWKCSSGCQPYNNKTLWCNVNHVTQSTNNVIEQQEFDQSEITATLSLYYIPSYDTNLHNTVFRFDFTISETDNKYHLSYSDIFIIYEMKYTIIFTDILSIIHHPNLSLDNFFTTLNSEYYQFYVGSSISLSMVTINLDATKPYGSFNVSSDDVISGRYTEDNPYITCT